MLEDKYFIKPTKPSEYNAGCITCCFCGTLCCDTHERSIYHTNNADTKNEKDRCCHKCNDSIVLSHRVGLMLG